MKLFLGILVAISALAFADSSTSPDNSGVNERYRTENADTAVRNQSDLKITQKIRQDIMADKDLSIYAHNVKIIAKDGKVALRGPVQSLEEKNKIALVAARVAGSANVVNDLEIKP